MGTRVRPAAQARPVPVVVTMLLQLLLGTRYPGHKVLDLPSARVAALAGRLSIGGTITGEALLNSFVSGLRLAVLIACFGAANALAHPARLVRILPAALYEVGVAIVVALTFVPQLAESVVACPGSAAAARPADHRPSRAARPHRPRARGGSRTGDSALPRRWILAGTAGARISRPRSRRISGAGVLLGLGGAVAGTYQIIGRRGQQRFGVVLLGVGPRSPSPAGCVAGRRVPAPGTAPIRGGVRSGSPSVAGGRRGRPTRWPCTTPWPPACPTPGRRCELVPFLVPRCLPRCPRS